HLALLLVRSKCPFQVRCGVAFTSARGDTVAEYLTRYLQDSMREVARAPVLDLPHRREKHRRGNLVDRLFPELREEILFEPTQHVRCVVVDPDARLSGVPLAGNLIEAVALTPKGVLLLLSALRAWIYAEGNKFSRGIASLARLGESDVIEHSEG